MAKSLTEGLFTAIGRGKPAHGGSPVYRFFKKNRSFSLVVALPTLITLLYSLFFYSNQYVVDFRFTIMPSPLSQSGQQSSSSSSSSSASSGGSADAGMYTLNNMVVDYIGSAQAAYDVNRLQPLKPVYDSRSIDLIHRFWWGGGTLEKLALYWRYFIVDANFDETTGLDDVKVTAYSPDEAVSIARLVRAASENLLNALSTRQKQDAVDYTRSEMEGAKRQLDQITEQEEAFRTATLSTDPVANGSANMALAGYLQQQLAILRAQRDSLRSTSPNAPTLHAVNNQVEALDRQLAEVNRRIGSGAISQGAGSSDATIASAMRKYEQLEVEKADALLNYNSTFGLYSAAKMHEALKDYYIVTYVEPLRPTSALYPQPVIGTLLVFVLLSIVWGIGVLFYSSTQMGGHK